MKRFLIAAAASLLIFGGQAEASTVDFETQDINGKWVHFRDKYILGRETENERRDRKEWENRQHEDRRRHRDDYRYVPPTPPPHYRDGKRYYPPPRPPQYQRDGKRYYPPNPPPTRNR